MIFYATSIIGAGLMYAYVAGKTCKSNLKEPEHPHRRGHGSFDSLNCKGPHYDILGKQSRCEVCNEIYKSHKGSWLWPITLIKKPFVEMYDAGRGAS